MAQNFLPFTTMPVDHPISAGVGVAFRESDFPFGGRDSAETAGLYGAVGVAKGNRGWADLPMRQALSGAGPFKNLKAGR